MMIKPKHFWCLSDGKTVKEISWEEWRKIALSDWNRGNNTRLICRIESSHLFVRKGKQQLYVPLKQLQQILEASKR